MFRGDGPPPDEAFMRPPSDASREERPQDFDRGPDRGPDAGRNPDRSGEPGSPRPDNGFDRNRGQGNDHFDDRGGDRGGDRNGQRGGDRGGGDRGFGMGFGMIPAWVRCLVEVQMVMGNGQVVLMVPVVQEQCVVTYRT